MNYVDFPKKSSVQIEENQWLRNVGYLWIVLGVFILGHAIYTSPPLSGKGFWITMGAGCVIWAHFSKVKYSVFRSERGNVFVIQDGKHDEIIEELNKRRKAQLLNWYGEVNPENEIKNEIGKFKWLAEQDVMTKEESERKIAQVTLLHTKESSDSSNRLLN